MKSCLTILLFFILIPFVWWAYSSYNKHIDCEACAEKPNNYYFHFKNWDKTEYYTLDCFCDTKPVLKRINVLRKKIMSIKKTDIGLLKDDFYGSGKMGNRGPYGGSHDDVPWDDVYVNAIVAQFRRDTTNINRLSYMWFKYTWATFSDMQVHHKELSKTSSRVVYSVDYEELNQSVLNQFVRTVYKDSTRFEYNTCVYHLYNRQAKTVEATMKYEDKGKGFYFEIW